jgi:hypothetical protein
MSALLDACRHGPGVWLAGQAIPNAATYIGRREQRTGTTGHPQTRSMHCKQRKSIQCVVEATSGWNVLT